MFPCPYLQWLLLLSSLVGAIATDAEPEPRLDWPGDPGAAFALARMGTTRFRPGAVKPMHAGLAQVPGHTCPLDDVSFSPNGKHLAFTGGGSTIFLWHVTAAARAVIPKGRLLLTKDDVARLWDDLGNGDAAVAHKAIWVLVKEPGTVGFLKQRLLQAGSAAEHIAKLIAELDDDDFEKREAASKELDRLGQSAVPALRAARKREISPEMRRRIDALLAKHGNRALLVPEGEPLRQARAVQVLELIGDLEARELLRKLRDGPASPMAEDAGIALERLERRKK